MVIWLRVALWLARGWREWRELAASGRDDGPRGPGGGLRLVHGEGAGRVEATAGRPAA